MHGYVRMALLSKKKKKHWKQLSNHEEDAEKTLENLLHTTQSFTARTARDV